jgi:hypothetical protein
VIALPSGGFGKGKRGSPKGKDHTDPCGDNSGEGCEEYYEWPSWTGWFTGYYGYVPCNLVSPICNFDCLLVDAVAGGTWSAKYNKKLSAFDNKSDVEDALLRKFKAIRSTARRSVRLIRCGRKPERNNVRASERGLSFLLKEEEKIIRKKEKGRKEKGGGRKEKGGGRREGNLGIRI